MRQNFLFKFGQACTFIFILIFFSHCKATTKKSTINIRIAKEKKEKVMKKMKQDNFKSVTDYIVNLINKDLNF